MANSPNLNLETQLEIIERIRLKAREREARQKPDRWQADDLSGSEWPRLERRP